MATWIYLHDLVSQCIIYEKLSSLPSCFFVVVFCYGIFVCVINLILWQGLYDLSIETWRPVGRPIIDQMKRFFMGGPPDIDDITYVATPKDFQVFETEPFILN